MARYRIAGLFLAVALVFLSPRSAPAGFEEGHAAYERGDYHTAFREMMPLALAGDPAAQFNLGVMYAQGRGVPRDDAEAVRWYRLAADQGFAEAQYILGAMYVAGRGVPQDDAGAVRWYRSAADQGVAEAQGALGAMYAFGQGVPRDDAEAVRWYRLAADQGSALGQLSLGAMYAEGRGVFRTTCWPTCGLVSPPLKGERSGRAQSRRATKLLRGCRQLNVPAGKSWRASGGPESRRSGELLRSSKISPTLATIPDPLTGSWGRGRAPRLGTSRLISACQSTARFPISFTPH
jgi:TPR repeat protein